jgi:hypothetical protein
VGKMTIQQARSGGSNEPTEKRTGKDGKSYKSVKRPGRKRTKADEAIANLKGAASQVTSTSTSILLPQPRQLARVWRKNPPPPIAWGKDSGAGQDTQNGCG